MFDWNDGVIFKCWDLNWHSRFEFPQAQYRLSEFYLDPAFIALSLKVLWYLELAKKFSLDKEEMLYYDTPIENPKVLLSFWIWMGYCTNECSDQITSNAMKIYSEWLFRWHNISSYQMKISSLFWKHEKTFGNWDISGVMYNIFPIFLYASDYQKIISNIRSLTD